jgi:hypothetical protein
MSCFDYAMMPMCTQQGDDLLKIAAGIRGLITASIIIRWIGFGNASPGMH